jgi:hypothetical protein
MVIFKKRLIVCLAVAVIFGSVPFLKATAQSVPMTDQQIQLIRNNCSSTKNTLNQLHSSDALLRVNRGQTYESMSTKLMDVFNGRVASNNINNTGFVSISNSYDSTLDVFRADYINYEKQLTLAIGIDCSKQPVTFYDAVALARTERNQVHTDVVKLDQLIDQYKLAIEQLGTSVGTKQ